MESSEPSMSGLLVARVLRFLSFVINDPEELHRCALVHWFSIFGNQLDPDNHGMWVVTPNYFGSAPSVSVIHADSIFRVAHLPIFDENPLPRTLNYTSTLDSSNSHRTRVLTRETSSEQWLKRSVCRDIGKGAKLEGHSGPFSALPVLSTSGMIKGEIFC
ncbi:hypothetical protein BDM02DRAFT_2865697 [Thelephora ganbajun]|uniref:Uncharacterized protein n=1 Tax=Thelephora ganbajun TaxID=370292 RepID=A0ACB6ZBW7_THEGA|nr:hypothetical protein BDM02DRAFT_2865697 [Thelephora ganbajun]